MSRPLVYAVAMSRHPLLMDDPTARDVLVVMADKAQDRNGGRIVASVASLAAASDRCSATVRHARDRLIAAGLVRKVGNGDTSKNAGVFYIDEEALNRVCQRFTPDQSPRNHKESDASLLPPLCPPIATALPSDCHGFAVALPPTRARLEQRTENREQEHQSAQARTHEGATIEQPVEAKPYTLPTHPVADAMLARVNAANALNRAALATRPGPLAPKVEPVPVPEAEPEPAPEQPAAPKPKSPGEQRLDAAVAEIMAHIAPTGQTEATLDKWRARLRSRLKAKGVSAEAIADRSQAVRKAWAYIRANGWHAANNRNTPGHFFGVTLRDDATLDRDAANTPRTHSFGAPTPKPWAMVGANTAPAEPEPVAEPLPLDLFEAPAPAPKPAPVAPRPAPERAAPESAARLFNAVLGKDTPRT